MALDMKRKRAGDNGSRKVCLSIFYDINFSLYAHRVAKLTMNTVNWRVIWTMVKVKKRAMLVQWEMMMMKNGGE